MAYIGLPPSNSFVSLKRQVITGDGTASYTLDHSVASVNDVAIFVNNVRQDPAGYSISGAALTLGGTIESSDDCYVIFLGQALQTVTPDANTITTAMIQDSAVTPVKLNLNDGVTITVDDNSDNLTLVSTDTDANYGPNIEMSRPVTGATNDLLGRIDFSGRDDAGNTHNYTSIEAIIADASSGSEDGRFMIRTEVAGATKNMFDMNGTELVINQDSVDYDFRVESNGNTHMLFVNAGNDRVGIGDSSPAYTLELGNSDSGNGVSIAAENNVHKFRCRASATDTQTHLQFENGNGVVGSIKTASSATQFNTSSDYRLKENIDYDWDATTRLKQLKPARFNWITDDTNTLLDGFIAHEVSSIVPEAITGNKDATETLTNVVKNADGSLYKCNFTEAEWEKGKKDGTFAADSTWAATFTRPDYQSIDQSKLVPLLVKTIQELEARITILENA